MSTDRRKPDLAQIKKLVSFPNLMSHYGFDLKTQPGNSLRGKCPLPTHNSEKDSNSFTATLKGTGWVWDCFSNSCAANRGRRKGGNILDFVMVMENDQSLFRIGVKLNDWFGLNAWLLNGNGSPIPGGCAGTAPRTAQRPESPLPEPASEPGPANTPTGCERNEPLAFQLRHIDFAHPYLRGRGITPETAEHFGVGYFSGNSKLLKGRCVFPIWSANGEGNPVAYAGRAIDGTEPKYVFPPGFRKSLELWNLHRVASGAERVIVLEGFFSLMHFHQAGIGNLVSLMGSTASEAQIRLLSRFPRVTLCLDPDEAGCAGVAAILPVLAAHTHIRALTLPGQPDELSPETIHQLLGADRSPK
jgi:Toprim-like/DNA primase catalytic core, N-terminal domain